MKKYILLVLILILCSGCEINYNLDIDEKNIKENIKFNVTEQDYNEYNDNQEEKLTEDLYEVFEEQHIPVFINDYSTFHKKISNKINNGLDLEYSYDYDYINFSKSYLINNCFENYVVLNEKDYYYIKAYGSFSCYYDKTNIKINTKYKVISNNADSVENGTYIWKIDDNNRNNVNIVFQMSKNELRKNTINEDNFNYTLITIISVLVVVAGCGVYAYMHFKKR